MPNVGIGNVFDKDRFVATVDYNISFDHKADTFTGNLNNVARTPTARKAKILTLHTAGNKKLDFSVPSMDTKGYQIFGKGDFRI